MILAYIQSIEDDNKRRVVEGIYNLYYKRMTACALGILKNYHDSQDAVQEVFYNITATYEQFVDAAAPATAALVHIYVRNAAINIYNKNKRHSKVVMLCDNIEDVAKDIVDEYADVQRIVIDNETTAIVSEAVDKLDDMYRDLIIMKYYYHMRNVDIAQVLNIDSNKVNSRIFRAKQKLKEILGTEAYERITR
jgi:RNA polymerase sigma-70 factor (ECF subfamily)